MSRLYFKYKNRINLFRNIVLFISVIILSKFFTIQVINSNDYKKQIFNKTISYKEQQGLRGNIYDTNKKLLAYTIQKCLFWISSENLNEENKLQIINLFSEEDMREKYPALKQAWEHYQSVLEVCKTKEQEDEN